MWGRDPIEPLDASSILQKLLDGLRMFRYIIAAWHFTAVPTFPVISGIDGLAMRTGVVFPHFLEPLFIAGRPDSFKIGPKLYPMGHGGLKLF
jgi:hypothetical protein